MPEPVVLQLSDRLDRTGQAADIFVLADHSRVYKLYRAGQKARTHRRLFLSEAIAYEAAIATSLRRHVPEYHGRTTISDVVDVDGHSHDTNYLMDCCLCLGYISGEDRKLGEIPDACREIALALLSEFERVRINVSWDCSFFNWCDRARITVIDFGPNDE